VHPCVVYWNKICFCKRAYLRLREPIFACFSPGTALLWNLMANHRAEWANNQQISNVWN